MSEEKGRNLDLSSDPTAADRSACGLPPGDHPSSGDPADRNRYIGVHFVCCDIYLRVYANRDRTGYDGRCPKCGKAVHFKIGSGGTNHRFFTAS